ncbi:MAG: PQQ-dependent sugar dehydrogenase, partial [Gaiella sp.]
TAPADNATLAGTITVTATASDNVGVAGVQFLLDGAPLGAEDTASPFETHWATTTAANGSHTLSARARDAAGNTVTTVAVGVTVSNSPAASPFTNETLSLGFSLPTSLEFLPNGTLLVAELQGRIAMLQPPYTTIAPAPFLQLTNVSQTGYQGIGDIALDPNFSLNRHLYVFYTSNTPRRDRLSRFTVNPALTGVETGSEVVLYQDTLDVGGEHHGGAIAFGSDGRLYFTTGDHFQPSTAPLLTSPRGKVHRIESDGTVPATNPFHDGAGPNVDSIWALGLRNPFRMTWDGARGRLLIADVGEGAFEELDAGVAGANYGWPTCEGPCANPSFVDPVYSYPHTGRDASITGGIVYTGTQLATFSGSYIFADYAQNWIRRLTFDPVGGVSGVFNVEPPDGAADGPYGDIVDLAQGPDGAVYYLDVGYSEITGSGIAKLRRLRPTQVNAAPVAVATATPASGQAPLTVNFSSAGSFDPEAGPLTFAWTFGDGTGSTLADPAHEYASPGTYPARLAVSDGTSTTQSDPITITVGNPPVPVIDAPTDGATFAAADVIAFSGSASDTEDGALATAALSWSVDFLHDGHVHPGQTVTGAAGGTFVIPRTGHTFSGNTRYRITLTATDSSGLSAARSVVVWPRKVTLAFDTVPSGLVLHLDGIANTTPFVSDSLVGFEHSLEARDQNWSGAGYSFVSWSHGGARLQTLSVPATGQAYTATYQQSTPVTATPAFVQKTGATSPTLAMAGVSAGNLLVLAVGMSNSAATPTVTDSQGNPWAMIRRVNDTANGQSSLVYAGRAGASGSLTVTVQNVGQSFDYYMLSEYSGTQAVTDGSAGQLITSVSSAIDAVTSGPVTTTVAGNLIVGFVQDTNGGRTWTPGTGFVERDELAPTEAPAPGQVETRVQTSVGPVAATWTASGGGTRAIAVVVAFKAAVG